MVEISLSYFYAHVTRSEQKGRLLGARRPFAPSKRPFYLLQTYVLGFVRMIMQEQHKYARWTDFSRDIVETPNLLP